MRRIVIGAYFALLGLSLLGGVWFLLPARYLPIDAGGSIVGGLQVLAAIAAFADRRWSRRVMILGAGSVLATGLLVVALLAVSVSYLSGVYGSIGQAGAGLFLLVMAALVPYVVIFPCYILRRVQ